MKENKSLFPFLMDSGLGFIFAVILWMKNKPRATPTAPPICPTQAPRAMDREIAGKNTIAIDNKHNAFPHHALK